MKIPYGVPKSNYDNVKIFPSPYYLSSNYSMVIEGLVYDGPGGLPIDLGQRESIAIQALNRAMKAGYSKNNQLLIKQYFNSLSKLPTDQVEQVNEDK